MIFGVFSLDARNLNSYSHLKLSSVPGVFFFCLTSNLLWRYDGAARHVCQLFVVLHSIECWGLSISNNSSTLIH